MFFGHATVRGNHCVEEERSRSEIDDRRASDTNGVKLGACEIVRRYWLADISLPDNRTIASIERVHRIRFSCRNDHRFTLRAVLDVKRLRVNVASNCAIEV